jgi:hypothetical protein
MNTKTINWKEEFTKLFPETTERTLKDNHKWCDKCNGLGFARKEIYIEFCNNCRGSGQIELCSKGCGRERKSGYYTVCETCLNKSDTEDKIKREKESFDKAQKIKFEDYDGMFIDGERAIDKDDFADNLYYKIKDGEDYLNYIYGTVKQPVMSIDIRDVIYNACDDGYEDMLDQLDYNGVEKIQELIDKWIEDQGESNYVYNETSKIVVLLDDLITEIKEQIEKEKKLK